MRFEEAYGGWESGRLTQAETASLLCMSERNFRRYVSRFESEEEEGLNGKLTVVKALTLRRLREIEVYRKHVFISVKDVEFPEHSVQDSKAALISGRIGFDFRTGIFAVLG